MSVSSKPGDLVVVEVAEVVGQRVGDGAREVGRVPRGLAPLDVGERRRNDGARRPARGRRLLSAQAEHGLRDTGQAAVDLGAQLRVPPVEHLLAGLALVALGFPGRERRLPGEPDQLQRVRRASESRLERRGQLRALGRDLAPPGAEQVHRRVGHADDLAGLPVGPRHGEHAERARQPRRQHALPDRRRSRPPTAQAAPVERPPHPIGALDAVEDRVVDVQVRVVLARVVLEERRDGPVVRVDVAAAGAAVMAGAGVAAAVGQVAERGVVARPDRVLDGLAVRGPRGRRLLVTRGTRLDLAGLERRVQHRDRLGDVERHVGERDVPPRLLSRGEPQLGPAFGGRVRLGVQHPGVQLVLGGVPASGMSEGGRLVPARRVAEPLVARVDEPLVQRGHVLVVDEPAQPERLGAAPGPAARRLARGDGAGVVVLAPGRDGVEQVGRRVPGGDRQHGGLPTAAGGGAPHHRIGMQRCVSLLFLLVVLRSCGRSRFWCWVIAASWWSRLGVRGGVLRVACGVP